ncbi:MAG: hypothetical protein AAB250_16330 [Bdellovibrionota bacterium]
MPIFTEHLREELGVIHFGLAQLGSARQSLLQGEAANIQDLRIVTYALRLLLKRSHLVKLESLLYPEIDPLDLDDEGFEKFSEQTERLYNGQARLQLMRLQLALDSFDERSSRDELARCIEDCVHVIDHVLDHETNIIFPLADRVLSPAKQKDLYTKAQDLDHKQAIERMQATQALLNMDLARASGS